jgi:hypothetical protein
MLFSGADGSEGDENLAEVVLAHLMREAINELINANQSHLAARIPSQSHSIAILRNRNQSIAHHRFSPARTPCGSSRERSRAAST